MPIQTQNITVEEGLELLLNGKRLVSRNKSYGYMPLLERDVVTANFSFVIKDIIKILDLYNLNHDYIPHEFIRLR